MVVKRRTMPRLVRALRECADASDEEQVAAVLATLLVQPQVTKQCEAKEYATVLFDQGFAALVLPNPKPRLEAAHAEVPLSRCKHGRIGVRCIR